MSLRNGMAFGLADAFGPVVQVSPFSTQAGS